MSKETKTPERTMDMALSKSFEAYSGYFKNRKELYQVRGALLAALNSINQLDSKAQIMSLRPGEVKIIDIYLRWIRRSARKLTRECIAVEKRLENDFKKPLN